VIADPSWMEGRVEISGRAYWNLLPYQNRVIEDDSKLRCVQKSRRVGMTPAFAYQIVADRPGIAGRPVKTINATYASITEDLGKEFIETVRDFCQMFGEAVQIVTTEELFGDEMLRVREIEFPPHRGERAKFHTVSSSPAVFRGRGGDVYIDEMAFHPWKASG